MTSSPSTPAGTITVSAASSLTGAFGTIKSDFVTSHPGSTVNVNFGSSGQLESQIESGAPADVAVIDTERRWRVEPAAFRSPGKCTPVAGWELKGRAVLTVVGGRIKYRL
jgi:ABC-type phosphate transport system substrate-binding protein